MSHLRETAAKEEEENTFNDSNEIGSKHHPQQQPIKENIKMKPLHIRMLNSKLQSPSDVLSPFSQKIVSERSSALKNLKPKSLTDTFLNSSPAVNKSSSRLGHVEESCEELNDEISQAEQDDEEEEEDVTLINEEQCGNNVQLVSFQNS